MSFFKYYSSPGSIWPLIPIPEHAQIISVYQGLTHTQWLSPKEIELNQLNQLNLMLKHCYDYSPYYKEVLDKSGIKNKQINDFDQFRKLPLLTRSLYQKNFKKILATHLPNGLSRSENPIYTSGTSGVPISVYKTNRDGLWWQAFAMRDFEWAGMDPRKKLASIRLIAMNPNDLPRALKGMSTPGWFPPVNGHPLFSSSPAYGMDSRQDPNTQLAWLTTVNPNYIVGMPSNLELLASLMKEQSKALPELEIIQTIGESLPDVLRDKLQAAFKVHVKNLYSTNECGYIASTCPSGEGLHVHAENAYTEVLNDKNKPCKPGETGRLVLTSLTNFANPFIRYDILDEVTLADGPCSCGRGLPLWKSVEGRRHPMLFLAGGRRKISTGIMLGLRQIGGVHQFQVIQHNENNFTVRVVPSKEWTDNHELMIIKCIQEEMEANNVYVDIKKEHNIEKPNGKLKIIVVEPEQK